MERIILEINARNKDEAIRALMKMLETVSENYDTDDQVVERVYVVSKAKVRPA